MTRLGIPKRDASTPPPTNKGKLLMTNEPDPLATTDLWPYNRSTGIIPRDMAQSIRAWALTCMTEAELRSYSQQQLLLMYVGHLDDELGKVLKPQRTPEESMATARAVLGLKDHECR
jgi:hypothetical protein